MKTLGNVARVGFVLFIFGIVVFAFIITRFDTPTQPQRTLLPTYTPVGAQPAPLPTVTPIPTATPAKPVKITGVETRIIEQNDTWWKHSWKVTIRNDGDLDGEVSFTLNFFDAEGFLLDDDGDTGLLVPAHSEQSFSNLALIDTEFAPKVAAIKAEINYVVVPGTLDVIQRGD